MAIVFAVNAAASAAAFTLNPMTATISPSGPDSVMTFKVDNDSSQQIAVSIKVATRSMSETGTESNSPADSQFLVFPSRLVLKPNSSQNVKIQYKGTPSLAYESAFRVIAEQLPVDFTKSANSGVNIMLRYIAALYVAPPKVKPVLLVSEAIGAIQSNKKGLLVTLKNDGTRHALLFNTLIRITQSTGSLPVEISGESMAEIEGQNLLAKASRKFFIPWEPAEVGATYEGAFNAEFE